MKRIFCLVILLGLSISSCAKPTVSPFDVQTAIAKTQIALPTPTTTVTSTVTSTSTTIPTSTTVPTATKTIFPTNTPMPAVVTCFTQSKQYIINVNAIIAKWETKIDEADSKTGSALSSIIDELTVIRNSVTDITTPSCVIRVHDLQRDYMQKYIDMYFEILKGVSAADKLTLELSAYIRYLNFKIEFDKLVKNQSPYNQ